MAPHSVRISGRDPYKENSTINGSLVAIWPILDCSSWWPRVEFSNHSLIKRHFFLFGVGSWKDPGSFRKFIRVETLKYAFVCLHGKIRVEDFGTRLRAKFYGFGGWCWAMLVLTIHRDQTQLVVSVSGDYELVKIVEGKPSYKKAREGLRSMELLLVPASYLCTHDPSVSPFTWIFFAFPSFSSSQVLERTLCWTLPRFFSGTWRSLKSGFQKILERYRGFQWP